MLWFWKGIRRLHLHWRSPDWLFYMRKTISKDGPMITVRRLICNSRASSETHLNKYMNEALDKRRRRLILLKSIDSNLCNSALSSLLLNSEGSFFPEKKEKKKKKKRRGILPGPVNWRQSNSVKSRREGEELGVSFGRQTGRKAALPKDAGRSLGHPTAGEDPSWCGVPEETCGNCTFTAGWQYQEEVMTRVAQALKSKRPAATLIDCCLKNFLFSTFIGRPNLKKSSSESTTTQNSFPTRIASTLGSSHFPKPAETLIQILRAASLRLRNGVVDWTADGVCVCVKTERSNPVSTPAFHTPLPPLFPTVHLVPFFHRSFVRSSYLAISYLIKKRTHKDVETTLAKKKRNLGVCKCV
ncbi:hypothetical protein VP01_470g2 [Puccinia sorghi]|uniref:Uncharacterized protein n=1 Tax=Puccinia sorghi TaxID=27349 RepID=A0A0L6UNT8_9BASI|nr:hypothetical protein VP01_470g2 [Puccinia sorghi]